MKISCAITNLLIEYFPREKQSLFYVIGFLCAFESLFSRGAFHNIASPIELYSSTDSDMVIKRSLMGNQKCLKLEDPTIPYS